MVTCRSFLLVALVVHGRHEGDILGGSCSRVRQDDGCGDDVWWVEVELAMV